MEAGRCCYPCPSKTLYPSKALEPELKWAFGAPGSMLASAFHPLRTLSELMILRDMKWWILCLPLGLTACGPRQTIVIDDPHRLVREATLQVCGSETPLKRHGSKLLVSQRVQC